MTNVIVILSVLCVWSAFVLWVLRYGMSYLYDFYLGETAVEIRLFRTFGIFRIPYNNIANVWEIRFLQGFPDKEASLASRLFTLTIGNRMTTRAVLIKRKNSVSKYVVISPRHPSLFVAEIRSKM